MKDKFIDYYDTDEKIRELSEYGHINFHLILTKMISEMRIKLNINPDMENTEGYVSLMVSLYGIMFNEIVYGLCGVCQTTSTKLPDIVPMLTLKILINLMEGKNPLNGSIRTDVKFTKEQMDHHYRENIDKLRQCIEALPK